MTSRAVRRLRRRSTLQPCSTSASDQLKATYRAWCRLMVLYRKWIEGQRFAPDLSPPPVDLRWVSSFDDFVEDVGLCPEGAAFEAINPAHPYTADNCHWSESPRKRHGRPPRILLTHQGETHSLSEWSNLLGLSYKTIYSRLKHGASDDDALAVAREGDQ
jgi:hypothetical protein